MRYAAILMALLLTLSLAACGNNAADDLMNDMKNPGTSQDNPTLNDDPTEPDNNVGTTPDTVPDTTPNTPDTTPDADRDPVTGNDEPNGTPNGGSNDTDMPNDANRPGDTGNTDGNGSMTGAMRRLMYNGMMYEVTDDVLEDDEVGLELFSITSIVEDIPTKDGDAMGLDEGTRVFRLKDENEYDEIAVEIGGVFYKAEKVGG